MSKLDSTFTKFKDLIQVIAGCNGTGRKVLSRLVAIGNITEAEAEVVYVHACVEKIKHSVNSIEEKLTY